MTKPLVKYDKKITHKSSSSPRDIQRRQVPIHTSLAADSEVLDLKRQLLDLRSELLDVKVSPSSVSDKLYTEEEFNAALIVALEKELEVGTVGKDSVEAQQLKSKLELSVDKLKTLEHTLGVRLQELIDLKSKVSTLEALIGAKDQTITALQNKPIIVNSVGGAIDSEPQYDVPDIEAGIIDPTDSNVKLESFINIAEERDESGSDMAADMSKLKDILGGGIKL